MQTKGFNDFYDKFCKPNGIFNHCAMPQFIFRGQSNEKYSLLPCIFRKEIREKWNKAFYNDTCRIESYSDQAELECGLLASFYEIANRNGVQLPFIPDSYKNIFLNDSPFVEITNNWLPPELFELAALAQHYGVPTRLLDWSFSVKVALYFMTLNTCKHHTQTGEYRSSNMVLWALRTFPIKVNKDFNEKIHIIVPEYSYNPNICAQKGVLVCWNSDTQERMDNLYMPLDDLLNQKRSTTTRGSSILYKILIPSQECYKMLEYLAIDGINASTIFPGHKGVADAVYEKSFYLSKDFPSEE